MNVPLLDPSRCNVSIMNELESTAVRILKSGKFILGKDVQEFEESFAEYLGVKHAIGVSSGTDALILSLLTIGIGPGDEVICPSFTFFATAGAIARVGATPVFVDIYPDCFTCDIEAIERELTFKTKAIIPVHLFGQSVDINPIVKFANKNNLAVIEDAAQAIGCEIDNKKVGSFGSTGCFSFFPSKNLGGFGDAGLVITQYDNLAEELRCMRVHGGKQQYIHERIGGNFRIDALQAALLKVKLSILPECEQARIDHANFYYEKLKDIDLYILPKQVRGKHVYNQFTIRILDGFRDKLRTYLSDNGIATGIYYPLPLHKQKCFKDTTPKNLELPNADLAAQECLSIPVASELYEKELEYVAEHLVKFAEENR